MSSVSGNIGGDQTAAFSIINPASHGLSFWWDDISAYEPDGPPWVERAETLEFNNYTVELQEMWGAFFNDYYTGVGAPTVTDPFAE